MLSEVSWGFASEVEDEINKVPIVQAIERQGKRRVHQYTVAMKRLHDAEMKKCEKALAIPRYCKSPLVAGATVPEHWPRFPAGGDPVDGGLPERRIRRKRQQLANMVSALCAILTDGDTLVDFCSGSGHVGLAIAALWPRCHVILVDRNVKALSIANERIRAAGLANARTCNVTVQDFKETFTVGCALHACGEASDAALEACARNSAPFVVAPCCIGQIKRAQLPYPRSETLRAVVTEKEYQLVTSAADFGDWGPDPEAWTEKEKERRKCKCLVEADRRSWAEENGYKCATFMMTPQRCTPKNDIIVGVPHAALNERIKVEKAQETKKLVSRNAVDEIEWFTSQSGRVYLQRWLKGALV